MKCSCTKWNVREWNERSEWSEWNEGMKCSCTYLSQHTGKDLFRGDTTKFLQTCWEDQISSSTWMWRQDKAFWLLTLPICGFLLELASPITVCLQRKKFPYLTWKLILLCLEHEPNSNFLKPSVDTVKGVRPPSAVLHRSPGGHSLIWPIRVCAAEQGIVFKVLGLLGMEAFQRVWRLAMSGLLLQCQ